MKNLLSTFSPIEFFRNIAYRGVIFWRAIRARILLFPNVRFNGLPVLRGNIRWGKNIIVNSGFYSNLYGLFQRTILYAYNGAEIVIGNDVGMSGVTLNARKRIEIGDGTLLGGNVKIFDHDFHATDFRFRNPDVIEKIGVSPVFIGARCFIGGGL